MRVERAEGLVVDGRWYRLRVAPGGSVAWLESRPTGERWAELRLLASIDTLGVPDETLAVHDPRLEDDQAGISLTWEQESSCWAARRLVIGADDEGLTVHAEVEGRGLVTDVRLLSGRAVLPTTGGGTLHSGRWFDAVLSPSPTDPGRIVRPGTESSVIGVVSGSEPGRGNWFFTPAPFCYAVSRRPVTDPLAVPDGPWLTFGLGVPPGQANFGGFSFVAVDRGFGFVLDYDGKTAVNGSWRTPALRISLDPGVSGPYEAIAAHGRWLQNQGLAPDDAFVSAATPAWWREPTFCGWGEQCRLAILDGAGFGGASAYSTQALYDRMLGHLAQQGVVPGTIVIDDKWQRAYGTNEPDPQRWPDLPGWIRERHATGQHVLLWWKAWDAERLPASWCVRSKTGEVLGIDPSHPEAARAIGESVRRMLDPDGLGADGLKIDFTARTPSGVATTHNGSAWGVELLRALLRIVHDEAKRVRPDALLVGHVPNPLVAGLVDMIRLNDTLRLSDPEPRVDVVAQMRHRAAVVRAACPGKLVDTDDWCAPDLATWRAYAAVKPDLGVPALYYATGLDLSGEPFEPSDYELVRRVWTDYRYREGLPAR